MCGGGGSRNEKGYEKNKRIWKILAIDYFHGFSTKGTWQYFPEENNEKLRELNTFQVKKLRCLQRALMIRKWFQKISYFSFREPESSTFGYTFFCIEDRLCFLSNLFLVKNMIFFNDLFILK